ncbi:GDSL-like Lipase/Acylhydrolase family protein [Lentzea fradiae]|uniref:GDSL-like Lipase/Acylhydrolase family protein n=1 Tax=Lentzea fradiae TaxID=200378 RepID=A0A1G7P760_9PSEU|nr:SGNH/GDSL hydrolase family protein [Lentzea fradiae]SDF82108.1 GDSL-like Lipase/Acylhydrolase family protein [Lentzea fradiae]
MRTKTAPRPRRLAAAAVALGSCLALTVPAGTATAAPADPAPTVFFGDSYTANFGISPVNDMGEPRMLCFQATENYPAVATRRLANKGVPLKVQSDVSCGGALLEHFWREQHLPFNMGEVPAQQDALKHDTQLAVGSIGGNTLGFSAILKQCSDQLRNASEQIAPGEPVDADSPAGQCAAFFTDGYGKDWLDDRFSQIEFELENLFDRVEFFSPAKLVLVGYPRLVPENTALCRTPAPGQTERPFADIPADALPVLDQVQKRLNDLMKKAAADSENDFVDLYGVTGSNTACDGANRGIGGVLEPSRLEQIPWFAHPNEKGRDIQAEHVATAIEKALTR